MNPVQQFWHDWDKMCVRLARRYRQERVRRLRDEYLKLKKENESQGQ